jgi:hypothetical protein
VLLTTIFALGYQCIDDHGHVKIFQHGQECGPQCGKFSAWFTVCNGDRQGGVSSGIFFAVYIDKLLMNLIESGHGIFCGDDIFLVLASINGLQTMVEICQ